ncbi:ASKHA domain-containing protein [Chloroflexota bacterium]
MGKNKDSKHNKTDHTSKYIPRHRPKHRTANFWLKVLPKELWLKVRRGETIWEVLQKADVDIESDCGGLGKCGKCKVKVHTAIGPPSKEAKALLHPEELKQGIRLACRTRIEKDLVITIGEMDTGEDYVQILKTGERPVLQLDPLLSQKYVALPYPDQIDQQEAISDFDRIKLVLGPQYKDLTASLGSLYNLSENLREYSYQGVVVLHEKCLLAWQEPNDLGQLWGLVFDVGTSTLVGKLINMVDGTEVAAVSRLNTQIRYGANIISRLQYLQQDKYNLNFLHNLLIRDLNGITRRLLKVEGLTPEDILVAVAAGNTTMQHLLLNLSPLGIAEAPFLPVLTDGVITKASDIGLKLNPEALLYTMPMQSGYIGGDLISTILASGAAEQDDKIVLGLDLGTNGEIFLGNRKRLITCSAAAGPALEGTSISAGMIAATGAIESVSLEEDDALHYQVIGNVQPKGLCGSGLVDLVAVLLHIGVINNQGLIRPPQRKMAREIASRITRKSGIYNFLIAPADQNNNGKPIYLTQRDIRELQLAKGAIAAGIQILMDEMGVQLADIQQVYLAGALGNYINAYSAMRIGLLPNVDPGIVTSLGNASSTGASMALLSKQYWQLANELSDSIKHVELSSRADFNQYFVEAMDFPEIDLW